MKVKKVKKVIISIIIILLILLYSIYLNVYQDTSILTSIVFAMLLCVFVIKKEIYNIRGITKSKKSKFIVFILINNKLNKNSRKIFCRFLSGNMQKKSL